MGHNYNAGSRDMGRAGKMVMKAAANRGAVSFSTASTVGNRWNQFVKWAREANIKQMERVTSEIVASFGYELAELVHNGRLAPSTAQNYLSAVNTVMKHATNFTWKPVSPTTDCGIPERIGIATESKAISQATHDDLLISILDERVTILMELQRSIGLRLEESAKLDTAHAFGEAQKTGQVSIDAGTKGGMSRVVSVSPDAVSILERAARIQGKDRSMIPGELTYAQFQVRCYKLLKQAGGSGFHGERHHYAQKRYQDLVGAPPPVVAGWPRFERFIRLAEYLGVSTKKALEFDTMARYRIARELGHQRLEITNVYLG